MVKATQKDHAQPGQILA